MCDVIDYHASIDDGDDDDDGGDGGGGGGGGVDAIVAKVIREK